MTGPILATAVVCTPGYQPDPEPTVAERLAALRSLALTNDDHDQQVLHAVVARLATPMSRPRRQELWDAATDAAALLDALARGVLEPRYVVPGAPAHSAHSIAAEVLNADLDAVCAQLVGAV